MGQAETADKAGAPIGPTKGEAGGKAQRAIDLGTRHQVIDLARSGFDATGKDLKSRLIGIAIKTMDITARVDHENPVLADHGHPDVAVTVKAEAIRERAAAQIVGTDRLLGTKSAVGPDDKADEAGVKGLDGVKMTAIRRDLDLIGEAKSVGNDLGRPLGAIEAQDLAVRLLRAQCL